MTKNDKAIFFTRGGQIVFHHIRMFFQVNKTLLKIDILLFLLMSGVITYLLVTPEEWINYFTLGYAKFLHSFHVDGTYHFLVFGKKIKVSTLTLLQDNYFQTVTSVIHQKVIAAMQMAAIAATALFLLIIGYFMYKGRRQSEDKFIRGAVLTTPAILKKIICKQNKQSDLSIDGLPLIKNCEIQHFLVHGTVGQGKSQWIMKLMDHLRSRGDRVIVYDKGAVFTSFYYQPDSDVILNPFDERCAPWNLWLEAPTDPQLENMAESLIPAHGETDPFWVDAARTVLSSAASKMGKDPNRNIEDLLDLLLTGKFEALEPYLTGTPAGTLVSSKIEKTAVSIRSVLSTYLKSLQALRGLSDSEEASFSIRDYILDPKQSGWLFISSNGDQHTSLKPLISMWLAMASLTLLSLTPDAKRRIWFICDELPSLHKLPLLGETIAEVRKFGGCFVLGMQSFSQLVKVYGKSGAEEIFDLLNTRAFFKNSSSNMAQLVSKELGDEEIEDNRASYSYGANSIRDGVSLGKHNLTRPIVTFSEIMQMEEKSCYMRLPGPYPVTLLKLKYQGRPIQEPGFVERKMPVVSNEPSLIEKSANVTQAPAKETTPPQPVENLAQEAAPQPSPVPPSTPHEVPPSKTEETLEECFL